ncbi:MAG TPA: PKD domain-containing protein [Pyrinomonadaceae bacterium]|jgi:WD40 repeat protein|nr:PKD domain-containing protein [Pyrinomonadaceae bacterium]
MSATLIDVDDLIAFIDDLRLTGYDISTQQYIGAQNLLITLAASGHLPSDPRALRTWLAPVLCSSPREQSNFYRRFDRWITQHPGWVGPKPIEANKVGPVIDEGVRRHWLSSLFQPKYLVPLFGLLVIVASVIFLPPLIPRTLAGQIIDSDTKQPLPNARISFGGRTSTSDGSGGFTITYRSKQLPDTLTADYPKHEPATLRIDTNSKSPLLLTLQEVGDPTDNSSTQIVTPSPPVTPEVVTPDPQVVNVRVVQRSAASKLKWIRIGAATLPFVIFGMWLFWDKKLNGALLKKLQSATQPHLDQIVVKGAAAQLFMGQSFRRTIQELRRHRQRGARELDAPGTVHKTIQRGGLFSPFYGSRQTLPEYLVLIDRTSFQDQQARFEEEIVRRLVQENVFVDSYYFQGDPRLCRTQGKDARFVTLQEMAALHPDHHLIIFSDGSSFLNPVSGAPEPWLELFAPWAKRAVLTSESPAHWGHREWILSELDFIVLPATKEGLAALTEVIDSDTTPRLDRNKRVRPFPAMLRERPRRWLENHEPASEIASQLCDQLKLSLGSKGYFWLSACAIYPALTWDLTLHLGFKLFSDRSEIEDRLLALVRLPWFRHGTLPDWLRSRLAAELSPEDEQRIRHTLEELFLTMLEQPAQGIQLDIAFGKGESERHSSGLVERLKKRFRSWNFKRFLRRALTDEPPESPLRDYVFLAFMSGRKPRKLTVSVPDSIRRLFFPQGQLALGMRPISALILAAIGSLALFFLVRPTEAGPPVEINSTLAGQLVVTASADTTARVWDSATGQTLIVLVGHTNFVHSAAFSPDGKDIVTASADYTARVWEVATGKTVFVLTGHTDSVYSAVFSRDGRYIVTASADKTARLWEAATGRSVMAISGHTGSVTSADFSPDGRYIVTASADKTARLWEVATGRSVMATNGHTDFIESAVFSPDGKFIVTASRDNTARVWDVANGREMLALSGPGLLSACFSPNGKYIATASRDNTVTVWEAATGRSVLLLSGHTGVVRSAAFSFDGNYIVTASDDQTARVWEAATGKTVQVLKGHTSAVTSAVFGPGASNVQPPVDIDKQIADLIAKFVGDERRDASDQLVKLYQQHKAAVVKALIGGLLVEGPDRYRVNLYIARTLGLIRPNWEGTTDQLGMLHTLTTSKDYQDETFKGWLDKAISNFSETQPINCDCAKVGAGALGTAYRSQLKCYEVEAQLKAEFMKTGTVSGVCDAVASGPNARPAGSAQSIKTPTPTPTASPTSTPQTATVTLLASPTRVTVGETVVFAIRIVPNIAEVKYTLNFGDRTRANLSPSASQVAHKYSRAGSYRVSVNAFVTGSGLILNINTNSVNVEVVASSGTIGVPECDLFIADYSACVSSKVPEVARPQYETAIEQWRTSWKKLAEKPQNRVTLAAACKQSANQARTLMKPYGCSF